MAPFGPGAGDGVEADLLQRLRLAADRLQLLRDGDLVEAARFRLAVEPGQEARHRHAVALVRGARALDLGGVLARLGQHAGIGGAHHAALAAFELAREPERRRRAEAHDLAGLLERRRAAAPARPASLILASGARCALASGPILAASTNSSGLPLAGTIANASATGLCATSEPRMLNSQQIESGNVSTTASWPSFFRSACSSLSFSSADLPAYLIGCGTTAPRGGAGRSLAPHAVDRVLRQRLQLDALAFQLLLQVVHGDRRMQPRIEADHGAGLERLAEPVRQLGRRHLQDLEDAGVHLLGRLQDVAAVDEQRGRLARHDGQSRPSPVNPVSQVSRCPHGGTYSFMYSSACGTSTASTPARAITSRNRATRSAVSCALPSGVS